MDDWQLLKQYASGNSEEAFRELVNRYAGMVYHAALRQTGNPHVAEEAAQVVFITLAQKAGGIPRQATLYGWLFRATRFAVLNQTRQNANRARREQEAFVMQPTSEPGESDSLWESITPHLNDALEKLSTADRELVMIRFFGNKTHRELAAVLGVSEDTARKRISRAVERLRAIFARRGIAMTSLALTAALAAHAAMAAPVELASSWANVAMAKAAAGASVTGTSGMLALLTSAKVPFAAVAIVLVGAVAFTVFKSDSSRPPVVATVAPTVSPAPIIAAKPAVETPPPAAPTNELDKVKAALHDPNPTDVYPNPVMQAAIAGLGDNKKLALTMLEAALSDADKEVCLRAIDGLGIVGPQAGDAAPLVLDVLRAGGVGQAIPQVNYSVTEFNGAARSFPIYTDNIILYTLGEIRPGPTAVAELARMMEANRYTCHVVYQATRQFNNTRRTLQAGGWLWGMSGESAKALNQAFVPLVQGPDRAARMVAALALVSALGDQADPAVFSVAAEMLKSDESPILPMDGLSLLQNAARDLSANESPADTTLNASRLGRHLNEVVLALAEVANHTERQALRLRASKMLDALVPDFRKLNPTLAAELDQEKQSNEFAMKVESDVVAMPEIVAGLKKFPTAAPVIANYFARNGSNGVALLPAFTEALFALAPAPDASDENRLAAVHLRQRLANAMQQIAPNLPKPIFTCMDAVKLTRIMNLQTNETDPDRAQRISAARLSAAWPTNGAAMRFDASPDEIRRLLDAIKGVDASTYDALAAKVKEIDPRFSN